MYTIFENDVTDSGTPRSVHTLRGVHAGRMDLNPNHLYITTQTVVLLCCYVSFPDLKKYVANCYGCRGYQNSVLYARI